MVMVTLCAETNGHRSLTHSTLARLESTVGECDTRNQLRPLFRFGVSGPIGSVIFCAGFEDTVNYKCACETVHGRLIERQALILDQGYIANILYCV